MLLLWVLPSPTEARQIQVSTLTTTWEIPQLPFCAPHPPKKVKDCLYCLLSRYWFIALRGRKQSCVYRAYYPEYPIRFTPPTQGSRFLQLPLGFRSVRHYEIEDEMVGLGPKKPPSRKGTGESLISMAPSMYFLCWFVLGSKRLCSRCISPVRLVPISSCNAIPTSGIIQEP